MTATRQKREKDRLIVREHLPSSPPSRATPPHAPAHALRTNRPAAIAPSSTSPERKPTCERRTRPLLRCPHPPAFRFLPRSPFLLRRSGPLPERTSPQG